MNMEQTKYDVFISYSRKDSAIVDEITTAFDQAGITYFIDRQGIMGGMEFPAVLSKAIRESRIFLFIASKNSYDSKFTLSEIVYAFNKKQKQDIIPYIIDGSTLPDELQFTFSAINWRCIEDHPINTTLIDDILLKVGRKRTSDETAAMPGFEQLKANQGSSLKKNSWLKRFNFSGKHVAITALTITIALLLWGIVVSKDFVQSHSVTLFLVTFLLLLVSFILLVIGYIRPASLCLPNRKKVSKFYLTAFFVMVITTIIFAGKSARTDESKDSIEPPEISQSVDR